MMQSDDAFCPFLSHVTHPLTPSCSCCRTHYAEAPDDAAFRHLATAYARGHAHMWNSSEFEGGITNGAAW